MLYIEGIYHRRPALQKTVSGHGIHVADGIDVVGSPALEHIDRTARPTRQKGAVHAIELLSRGRPNIAHFVITLQPGNRLGTEFLNSRPSHLHHLQITQYCRGHGDVSSVFPVLPDWA
jgi:hypothetical protein